MARRIAFAADHAGVQLKAALFEQCRAAGYEVLDLGTQGDDRVDYPDYAAAGARAIQDEQCDRAVLVCGSGIGMAMTANRFEGVRAVVAGYEAQARLARAHNDANVLCLGQRLTGPELAGSILRVFLETEFEGGRHAGRVIKLEECGGHPASSGG
ncbi:MAG: ribose 5-phosphate isomerase B [Myxococcota bacterium]